VDACNPLLQAHPTWARDEHEGRGIPTSLTPVSGRLASPPFALALTLDPSGLGHAATLTRRPKGPPGLGTPTISEKLSPEKLSPEPKVAAAGKRKTASPELKTLVREEDTPATPSAAEVEEIMKVMTEPLPVKLSPLALELTKFFQKDKAASAEESPAVSKKRRIIQIADVIHQTPPPATMSKIVFAETTEAEGATAEASRVETTEAETGKAEAAGAEAGTTEGSNLEATLEVIDNILLKMAEEEAIVAAVNTATEKGKEQIDDILEEENFNFQDLLGQDLTGAEKEELKKYAMSCGYKPGATLFGGGQRREAKMPSEPHRDQSC
jgi:hypothetical protein